MAEKMFNDPPYKIIETKIPKTIFDSLPADLKVIVDGGIPEILIPTESLGILSVSSPNVRVTHSSLAQPNLATNNNLASATKQSASSISSASAEVQNTFSRETQRLIDINKLTRNKLISYLEHINEIPKEQLIVDLKSVGLIPKGSPDSLFIEFVHVKETEVITKQLLREKTVQFKIHPPDDVTKYSHAHLYDKCGNPLNADLLITRKNSPDAHIKIADLASMIMENKPQ